MAKKLWPDDVNEAMRKMENSEIERYWRDARRAATDKEIKDLAFAFSEGIRRMGEDTATEIFAHLGLWLIKNGSSRSTDE